MWKALLKLENSLGVKADTKSSYTYTVHIVRGVFIGELGKPAQFSGLFNQISQSKTEVIPDDERVDEWNGA